MPSKTYAWVVILQCWLHDTDMLFIVLYYCFTVYLTCHALDNFQNLLSLIWIPFVSSSLYSLQTLQYTSTEGLQQHVLQP